MLRILSVAQHGYHYVSKAVAGYGWVTLASDNVTAVVQADEEIYRAIGNVVEVRG